MTTIAGGTTKKVYPLIPAGTHPAVLYKFMNLGTRYQMFEGKKKERPDTVITLTFEVPGEMNKFTVKNEDGTEEEVEKPLVISKEFNLTMGPKSKLRPFVEGIIGVQLKDEEAYAFDLEDLVGKTCLISVAHKQSKDGSRTFANLTGTAPLIKGMVPPTQVNPISVFNVNTCKKEDVDAMPEWLKDKITISDEYKRRFGTSDDTASIEEEGVPF